MSETFDLAAFIEGSSYPTKTVTVYTNVAALKQAEDLSLKAAGLDNKGVPLKIQPDAEQLTEYENKLDMVRVEIEKSALNFELQGLPFRLAQKIADIFNEEEPPADDQIVELMVKTIQGVTNVDGAKTSKPDAAMLETMRLRFSPAEYTKLVNGVFEVNFSAASYEADIDAGFPGGSSDME